MNKEKAKAGGWGGGEKGGDRNHKYESSHYNKIDKMCHYRSNNRQHSRLKKTNM